MTEPSPAERQRLEAARLRDAAAVAKRTRIKHAVINIAAVLVISGTGLLAWHWAPLRSPYPGLENKHFTGCVRLGKAVMAKQAKAYDRDAGQRARSRRAYEAAYEDWRVACSLDNWVVLAALARETGDFPISPEDWAALR